MNFVLSIVRSPEEGAGFGKSLVYEAVNSEQAAADKGADLLILKGVRTLEARSFATALAHELLGTERVHAGTGLIFRIDPEDQAPNVCPCCGRLVKWGDHAFAGSDDAYCLGCYTWDRNAGPCLPENTAHTEEPS
jgi:hypothetical protein